MTLFGDLYFFIACLVLMIPAIIMGLREKNIRYYGLVVSIFFAWMAMSSSPKAFLNLWLYVGFELILVKLYLWLYKRRDKDKGRSGFQYWLFLILSLMPLGVWKVSSFLGDSIFAFLGLSYMTFKTAQMIIEIYDGLIKDVRPIDFIYFLIFFPCLSSGPIDRSRRFDEDLNRFISKAEYENMLGDGIEKMVTGLAYKVVFSALLYQGVIWLGTGASFWNHLAYMYCYGGYLFFDFAGYSLMAIGASYIFGIRTPENFNKPFSSKDLKDFWDRWHMTLSYWFRDFVFSRFMMKAIKGKWFKSRLTGASIGFMINMFLMGLWHGFDIYYLMYGLYHGILLSLTEIYQKKSSFHKRHRKDVWYIRTNKFITFNLVMFGFFLFSGEFTRLIGLS